MKISRYAVRVKLNNGEILLYNTVDKTYFSYPEEEEGRMECILHNLNKGTYDESEIAILQELVQKKIVLADAADEMDELVYRENQIRFQSDTFHIMIIVTNGCNFRCPYCVQEHENVALSDDSAEKIISLIRQRSQSARRIKITWFGGEPLLQYKRVRKMMERAISICEKNRCELEAGMVSNGYLLNRERIAELKKLHFTMLQITLDGDRKSHDKRRFLANGEGTYDVIVNNIAMIAEYGIPMILRMNIDDTNADSVCDILELIPQEYRSTVTVSVANLYQTEKKISPYKIYERAIEMGYLYKMRNNVFMACQVCLMNGVVIDANGKIIVCANARSEDKELGYLSDDGEMIIQNTALYYKLKTISALQNEECRNCKELPFCIATCKYRRSINNKSCIGKRNDGLTLEERAYLDYYYDKQRRSFV